MIEYKTDSSKENHSIHVETDNYKYYRIIEEFVRMFIDHKLDFINIDEGADKDDRDNKENYDKGYADGYSAAMKTVQDALFKTDMKGNDE